jgi:hypothetical protein
VTGVVAGVVLIVTGLHLAAGATTTHERRTLDAAPLPAVTFAVGEQPSSSTRRVPTPAARPGCAATPSAGHLVIPSLCVDAPTTPTARTDEGALTIPPDVREVGLWDAGAPLTGPDGSPLTFGTTLIAGHVNALGQGNGALYALSQIRAGALVLAADEAGHVTAWRVVGLQVVNKARLPESVFAGRTGPRLLVLVTCGGPILHVPGYGNTYLDNVIATAVPA